MRHDEEGAAGPFAEDRDCSLLQFLPPLSQDNGKVTNAKVWS